MATKSEPMRILVISKAATIAPLVREILPNEQYPSVQSVTTAGEGKRALLNTIFDLIVINAPLADDFGIQTALDIASQHHTGILLLVKYELYEQVCHKVEDLGIVTLPKPTSRQMVYTALKMLTAMQSRLHQLEQQTHTLQSKMEEIRLVNRAKWILVEHLNMSEPEAHRYIEKQAMDRCVKRGQIAENIIKTYF